MKISGHMLNQGMMGSDFSYQDMLESDKLTDFIPVYIDRRGELGGSPLLCVGRNSQKASRSPITGVNHG